MLGLAAFVTQVLERADDRAKGQPGVSDVRAKRHEQSRKKPWSDIPRVQCIIKIAYS